MGNVCECCGGSGHTTTGTARKKVMTERRRVVLTDDGTTTAGSRNSAAGSGTGDHSALLRTDGAQSSDPYQRWYSSLDSTDPLTTAGRLPVKGEGNEKSSNPVNSSVESLTDHSESTNLRSFLIIRHVTYGLLLLKSFKKKKGGIHYQLPGGRVNSEELRKFGMTRQTMKRAALRELYEETGLKNIPLSQLKWLDFRRKNRSYFLLDITDSASLASSKDGEVSYSMSDLQQSESGESFWLQLSHEHIGFCFESNLKKAATMVERHSGGESKVAVLLFAQQCSNDSESHSAK